MKWMKYYATITYLLTYILIQGIYHGTRSAKIKLPAGFIVPGRAITDQDRRDYVLKLEKNLYGQKQAGRVWYLHLKKNLLKLGFKPSQHDECVFIMEKQFS